MKKLRTGVAMCGSYCTYGRAMEAIKRLCGEYDVTPIMSENSSVTDSRFGTAEEFKKQLREYTGKEIIDSIKKAEPIGPKALLDVLVILPCTGNTIAKLAGGITDSSVTMAAKAHLRNGRPVVIAVSTNDGLGANAKNIGELLARKNVYFVPFYQDDPEAKPCSLVADFDKIEETVEVALQGKQLQPVIISK
ncbi:MAG: dipicolinate synthase subunit B [Oscillospiraceae bacterium]